MKSIIIFNLLAISIYNQTVIAHADHDHQIYNWPNSKIKTIKSKSIFKLEKLEEKKNETKTNTKKK